MHTNVRRVLQTSLLTGGLVVVGAAGAHAANDDSAVDGIVESSAISSVSETVERTAESGSADANDEAICESTDDDLLAVLDGILPTSTDGECDDSDQPEVTTTVEQTVVSDTSAVQPEAADEGTSIDGQESAQNESAVEHQGGDEDHGDAAETSASDESAAEASVSAGESSDGAATVVVDPKLRVAAMTSRRQLQRVRVSAQKQKKSAAPLRM